MSLLDVNERPIGTVARVLQSSFIASIDGELREIGREALFSVDPFGATLVCDRESVLRYLVR